MSQLILRNKASWIPSDYMRDFFYVFAFLVSGFVVIFSTTDSLFWIRSSDAIICYIEFAILKILGHLLSNFLDP